MKELLHNLKYMDANEFQKVYKKTKDFFQKTDKPAQSPKPSAPPSKTGSQVWHDTGYTDKKAAQKKDEPIKEDELNEEDLIILPGMLKGKDKSFISKEHDRRDHEVEMARSDLYAAAKNAMRIFQLLKNRTEDEGLMGWQQSYITLAADYLNSVADSLEHQAHTNEMTGGVLAGGMSNFEEGVAEGKCVECGGPAFSEEHIAEAKDACYNKVKSRYKVWPSAYASGALVKCRKVGASNWGNKSKK
jgi:hypothetical protein